LVNCSYKHVLSFISKQNRHIVVRMPIELKYNKKLNYLLIVAKGHPTTEEADRGMDEICNSGEMPANVNSLLDMRELLFDHIDFEYLNRFVKIRKKYDKQRGMAKVALLSGSTLAAPLIKLFTILSRDLSQRLQVFKSVEEAELWLCEEMFNKSGTVKKLN